ncbi:MAG: pyridoxamine 5'-phosphate oxidase family protein [Gammaproteobacteria bacterium]|nr:pyridoxamine 5'-phosphate oxidase family protein [Gammaproteobacteria bacterium]
MNTLEETAPAFVEMAHRIVWCSAASVDRHNRPRSRVLHPLWHWDGSSLSGWIATGPTPTKRAHLTASPHLSLNYWDQAHDTCVAECRVSWALDLETRRQVWEAFKSAPPPVGYDPAMIPGWDGPESDTFAALRLEPWRLRVMPASVLMGQGGEILTWQA